MRSRIGAHQALFDKIDLLSARARELPYELNNLQAELCKYCCVLASAAIDLCIEDCLLEYSERAGDERILTYIKRQIGRARNPTVATLCFMLESFDQSWRSGLEQYANDTVRSDIGSIVHNRNEIAHGRSSTITFGRLLPWVRTARNVCGEIERIIFA
jgi:transcriptional regulator with XRE-family HTH domain